MRPNPLALIIDDEPAICRMLRVVLEREDYRVEDAANGVQGLQQAAALRPDVIILDLGLPDMSGQVLLQRLREWCRAPVLVLSARVGEEDKVAALNGGANDYVTKPFSTVELVARLRVLQRCHAGVVEEPMLIEGDLRIDVAAHEVTLKGRKLELTATEEALLLLLARYSGRPVSIQHLLRSIWGSEDRSYVGTLRVYILNLRRKLEEMDGGIWIRSERGIGYRLLLEGGREVVC